MRWAIWVLAYFWFLPSVVSLHADERIGKRSFGSAQVHLFALDRPCTSPFVDEKHPFRDWLVEKFEAGFDGRRIHWDVTPPPKGVHAENIPQFTTRHGPPCVRVTNDRSISGVAKCCCLIFELENIQNFHEFHNLCLRASKGDIEETGFLTAVMKLEHRALLRARKRILEWSDLFPNSTETARLIATPATFDEYYKKRKHLLEGRYANHIKSLFHRYRNAGNNLKTSPSQGSQRALNTN